MLCVIWYIIYNFKNVKNIHGRVPCSCTKSNTLPWVFFMFFKLYKWYLMAQRITYGQLTQYNCRHILCIVLVFISHFPFSPPFSFKLVHFFSNNSYFYQVLPERIRSAFLSWFTFALSKSLEIWNKLGILTH